MTPAPGCCPPPASGSCAPAAPDPRRPRLRTVTGAIPPSLRLQDSMKLVSYESEIILRRRQMRLTVFAATGGIGRHLVDQAVAAGHDVTAVARSPRNLPADGRFRVVAADLANPDPAVLASAVEGADAVLSALGPRNPRPDAGIA